jgi:hypothetical protein
MAVKDKSDKLEEYNQFDELTPVAVEVDSSIV